MSLTLTLNCLVVLRSYFDRHFFVWHMGFAGLETLIFLRATGWKLHIYYSLSHEFLYFSVHGLQLNKCLATP